MEDKDARAESPAAQAGDKGAAKPPAEAAAESPPAKAAPKKKESIIKAPSFEAASSPHQHSGDTVPSIMWMVFLALVPATAVGVYYFGWPAVKVLAASIVGCMVVEALSQKAMGQPVTVRDGSAALTGILLAMNVPPSSPIWMVLVGCAAAIFVGKQVFGGLGYNPFNPALVARVFLLISFPVQMTTWSAPTPLFATATDAVTAATPLTQIKMDLLTTGKAMVPESFSLFDALMGNIPGSMGETSGIFLILGGLFLMYRKIITWHVPVSYLATVAAIAAACHAIDPARFPGADFQLVTGGLLLGAFFMATDYVTSPVSPRGMLIFGAGCGALTIVIRYWGGYPEGVSFAILLMNMCVPLIDNYTQPRVFGQVSGRA